MGIFPIGISGLEIVRRAILEREQQCFFGYQTAGILWFPGEREYFTLPVCRVVEYWKLRAGIGRRTQQKNGSTCAYSHWIDMGKSHYTGLWSGYWNEQWETSVHRRLLCA